jgi:peptide deformylase
MVLEIAHIGNPVLRAVTPEMSSDDLTSPSVQTFIDDLIETKRAANGAGIAASQVSRPLRLFIVEVENNPRYPYKPDIPLDIVVNPVITFLTEERFDNYEGCLSIPDLRGIVPRCPEIRVSGLDRNGDPVDRIVRGITAGTYQHEHDHVNGILFPDRVEDMRTLCTWDEFVKRHEASFRSRVGEIVERYGS